MSKIIVSIDSPRGADLIVSGIQNALCYVEDAITSERISGLEWLDVIYGIARRGEEKSSNGRTYYFPKIYTQKKEYSPLHFNDKLKGQCFFILQDPVSFDSYIPGNSILRYNLSIVFTVNLRRIDNRKTFDYHFEQVLISEVQRILSTINADFSLTIRSIYTQDIDSIFNEYSIEQMEKQLLVYPYTSFRFEIEAVVPETCISNYNHEFIKCN